MTGSVSTRDGYDFGLLIAAVSAYSPFAASAGVRTLVRRSALAVAGAAALGDACWVTDAALYRPRSQAGPFTGALGICALCYAGLAVSLPPDVVPHQITLQQVAAAPQSQAFLLIGTLLLLPIILGYTAWSYWVFRGNVRAGAGYA